MFPDGRLPTPVFRRDSLRAGHVIAGPAVVEEAASVTMLNPGQALRSTTTAICCWRRNPEIGSSRS